MHCVCIYICVSLVSPDVLLILWEAPVGDAELQLLGDRGVDLLHYLKRDVECYLFG